MTDKEKIKAALERIFESGGVDGAHHKMWVLDQVVRILTNCPKIKKTAIDCKGREYEYVGLGESEEYLEWLRKHADGEDGPHTYEWDIGIAP